MRRGVEERMAAQAEGTMRDNGFDEVSTRTDRATEAIGTGGCVQVVAEAEASEVRIAGSEVAQKGVRAEEVARRACELVVEAKSKGASVDERMADQLIAFMAVAHGGSRIDCPRVSDHCATAMEVASRITGATFLVESAGSCSRIRCEGVGIASR